MRKMLCLLLLLLLPACKQSLPADTAAQAIAETSDVTQEKYHEAVAYAVSNSVPITAPPEALVMVQDGQTEPEVPAEETAPPVQGNDLAFPPEEVQKTVLREEELPQDELLPYVRMAIDKIARTEQIEEETAHIAYLLTYRQDGFLSLLVEAEDENGNVALQTLNIDMATGLEKPISAFFSGEDASWRGALADVVSQVAGQQQITLLNEIPPVADDQMFYVVGNGEIVLVYRPYEITTYQGGYPCFSLPTEALQEYATGAYGTCDMQSDAGEEQ